MVVGLNPRMVETMDSDEALPLHGDCASLTSDDSDEEDDYYEEHRTDTSVAKLILNEYPRR
jgi:hypothetical protein